MPRFYKNTLAIEIADALELKCGAIIDTHMDEKTDKDSQDFGLFLGGHLSEIQSCNNNKERIADAIRLVLTELGKQPKTKYIESITAVFQHYLDVLPQQTHNQNPNQNSAIKLQKN